jgi:hypothetical protein
MDFDRIFVVSDGMTRRALVVRPVDESLDGWALIQGRSKPRHPVKSRKHMGSQAPDFLSGGDPALKLITDRVVPRLERERFTLAGASPAELQERIGNTPGWRIERLGNRAETPPAE